MSITAVTTDSLPSDVPELLPDGVNWGIFEIRFSAAVKSKGKWPHFDGSTPRPLLSPEGRDIAVIDWDKAESSAYNLLQKIPDSAVFDVIRPLRKPGLHSPKSTHRRCPDRGDVRVFLDSLRVKEELASVGVDIDDKDYRLTIIGSLPPSLATYANSLLTATKLLSTSALGSSDIDPDTLIIVISEEYDRQRVQRERRAMAKAKKARRKGLPAGSVGGVGHKRNECKNKKKDSGSAKPKPSGSANAVETSSSDDKFAFAVEEGTDLDSLPDLHSESESNVSNTVESCGGHADAAMDDDWIGAVSHPLSPARIELFDSGCTSHISPYCDDFARLTPIDHKPFHAANKKPFSATAKDELVIDIPHGTTSSNLHLTEVFYSPEVGYTLVSVGWLDNAGFEVTFGQGKCIIKGQDGTLVGEVLKDDGGLYCLRHHSGKASAAEEVISLDQFHCQMGHISPEVAQKLITKGFVTGVHLKSSNEKDFFSKSCVYAKSTQRAVAKVCQGEQAKEFAEEIHSNIWGPAPVQTISGLEDGSFLEEYALAAEIADVEGLEPRTVAEAKRGPDWKLWEKAIEDKLELLRKAGMWELVNKPGNINIVGSKWVFKVKKDTARNIIKYKACLVVQGYSQVPGINYFDTFAPIAKLASI
ncbi:hypothetical protein E4T56_gene7174 [Termitomyces sp. T112]|nr:hypothetical protein E4T56_gene7174 [Termitomyces sp. T112]